MNLFDNLVPESEGKGYTPDYSSAPTFDFSSLYKGEAEVKSGRTGLSLSLDDDIARVESGGNYKALNPHSSAVGKYQFLWGNWGSQIQSVTGVHSKEEFRDNPDAQEKFYGWYKQNELLPAVSRLKTYNRKGLNDDQLAKLVHFKGEGGARLWLTQGRDTTSSNNIPIERYLGMRDNVDLSGIEDDVMGATQELQSKFPSLVITSGRRSWGDKDAHPVGRAIDLGGDNKTLREAADYYASNIVPRYGFERPLSINHGTGPHLHVGHYNKGGKVNKIETWLDK